jgi:hypothetical protein
MIQSDPWDETARLEKQVEAELLEWLKPPKRRVRDGHGQTGSTDPKRVQPPEGERSPSGD